MHAHTRDVSSRGISFYFPTPLEVGSKLHLIMTLPPELTLSAAIRVQCNGHVIRIEREAERNGFTIAAVIDHYDFLAD